VRALRPTDSRVDWLKIAVVEAGGGKGGSTKILTIYVLGIS
jgi:hypothetical protein